MSDKALDIYNAVIATQGKDTKYKNPTDPKTVFVDPYNIGSYVGVRAKPSPVGYAVLRSMASRAKPVAAIIHTRQNQVARFAKRPQYDGDTGFRITTKDPDQKPSAADKKEARRIEEALLGTGFIPNLKRKDNFDAFLRKIVRDSLVLDAMSYEIVPDHKGNVTEWWAVDGATIEVVMDMAQPNIETTVYQPVTRQGMLEAGNIAYVQRVFGEIAAEYTEQELAYGIRNPRTDVEYAMFGLSELEELIDIVTHLLNATAYNGGYFTNNNLPQGVLEIVGKFEEEHLEAFQRAWTNLVSGAVNKWKVPIMALEEGNGLKFTPFKQNSKDMEFHMWLDFLTTISCAVYQIDPMEIGFKAWQPLGTQGQFNSEAEKTRSDNSHSKGLFPLMQFLAGNLNSELINRINPDFKFEWVGLNEDDKVAKEDMRNKRLTNGFTLVAEERAAEDKEAIIDIYMRDLGMSKEEAIKKAAWAYAPANPQLIQVYTQGMMGDQQANQLDKTQQFQGQQTDKAQDFDMKKMGMQHNQTLEAGQVQHENTKELTGIQQKFTADEAAKVHSRQLESGALQQNYQQENMSKQQKFTADEAAKAHSRQLESGALQQNYQQENMGKQAQLSETAAGKAHERTLEQGAIKHQQNQELLANKTNDDKQKQKKELRKSLSADDDTFTIEIELD